MEAYEITYTRNGKEHTQIRISDTAENAIESLCNQYGWEYKINMIDADSCGKEWCKVAIDPDGGINWRFTAIAIRTTLEITEEA